MDRFPVRRAGVSRVGQVELTVGTAAGKQRAGVDRFPGVCRIARGSSSKWRVFARTPTAAAAAISLISGEFVLALTTTPFFWRIDKHASSSCTHRATSVIGEITRRLSIAAECDVVQLWSEFCSETRWRTLWSFTEMASLVCVNKQRLNNLHNYNWTHCDSGGIISCRIICTRFLACLSIINNL